MTLEEFNTISPGTIFATGILENSPEGIYMTEEGGRLRWVAVKGYANDWAVYCLWPYYTEKYVAENGDKVVSEAYIRRCVPCSDEVFNRYRY